MRKMAHSARFVHENRDAEHENGAPDMPFLAQSSETWSQTKRARCDDTVDTAKQQTRIKKVCTRRPTLEKLCVRVTCAAGRRITQPDAKA